eukprot:TRINITY_DN24907_c0_g1_i1.p1 TRINITY_DN24907_c0_g1~~TRINITY_DN24907_c0_g1_i1.p1  ORF type:complete len:514 (+),score=62.85 TRINITY_DN24907_c0_g1_i1:82-1623(+)
MESQSTDVRTNGARPRDEAMAPTPLRKRIRHQEQHDCHLFDCEDSDIELVQEAIGAGAGRPSLSACVPCEICGQAIPFQKYTEHISSHTASAQPSEEASSATAATSASDCQSHAQNSRARDQVPCDICGKMVYFSEFVEHAASHRTAAQPASHANAGRSESPRFEACDICGICIDPSEMTDHKAAHEVHDKLLESELQQSASEVDVTMQIVELARRGGSGLPGNRQNVSVGDSVLVRWEDGHWYHAHVQSANEDASKQVSWDPPYQSWDPETVLDDEIIPRMNQAREVCNFDVALAFVQKLKSLQHDIRKGVCDALEIVYHYTREENVQLIVENNLKVPGDRNDDGSEVVVKNGEVYGRGIYAATDLNFAKSFGGGLSCAFMCLAIPGKASQAKRIRAKEDSLQHGALRVYRTSNQLLPLFFTDARHAPALERCANEICTHLQAKLLGLPEAARTSRMSVGTSVKVFDTGVWWNATVAKVRSNGTYDVRWMPPFARWAPGLGVKPSCVRWMSS